MNIRTQCFFVLKDAVGRLLLRRKSETICLPGAWKAPTSAQTARAALENAIAIRKLAEPDLIHTTLAPVDASDAKIEIYAIRDADIAIGHDMFWEYPDRVHGPIGEGLKAFFSAIESKRAT